MARKKFWEIFKENPNGSLTPLKTISVNGVEFNSQVSFGPGVNFGGVNFHLFKNLDIAVEEKDHALVIKGFYK
ncbi:hypothetical protein HZA87_02540 [Candidatus Uhrbacteria bacterium]|nr:hypothetical protein [Candidatus Uhrbacteria bacterium]